jgi:hypothetical protein
MTTFEIICFYTGWIVNIILFIYSIILLKSVRYSNKILITNKEWKSIKFPIIAWIFFIASCIIPYFGGICIFTIFNFIINNYIDEEIYAKKETLIHKNLKSITSELIKILKLPFKWLFIKI